MTSKKATKKLNRLDVKKETIADLNVPEADKVKGGTNATYFRCPKPKPIGQTDKIAGNN